MFSIKSSSKVSVMDLVAAIEESFANQHDGDEATISALQKAQDHVDYEEIQAAAHRGYIAAALMKSGFMGDAIGKAASILSLLGHKDGGGDDRRTKAEENMYGAARAAWLRLSKKAGVISPKKLAGNTNAKKESKPRPPGSTEPVTVMVSADLKHTSIGPKAIKADDVRSKILDIAALCAKIENQDAAAITMDEREFFTFVRDYAKKLAVPVKLAA